MLEAARRAEPARIVHTSTSEVYGTAQTRPDRRGASAAPAVAVRGERRSAPTSSRCRSTRSFGTPVVVARPFNTYGPRQRARAVIPTIITQALPRDVGRARRDRSDARLPLRRGHGRAGSCAAPSADGVEGEVINLGTGIEISIGELARARPRPRRPGAAGRARRASASARPTARSSGWSPTRRRRSACSAGSRRSTSTRACADDRVAHGLSRRLQAVDLQRLTQRLDHRVGLLVGHVGHTAAT